MFSTARSVFHPQKSQLCGSSARSSASRIKVDFFATSDGADEWDDSISRSVCVDFERGVFVPVGDVGSTVEGSQVKTQKAAQKWWKNRVDEAEAFLEARVCGKDHNGIQAAANSRPAFVVYFMNSNSLR